MAELSNTELPQADGPRVAVIDVEADDLNATRIHCIVARVLGDGDHRVFDSSSATWMEEFKAWATSVDIFVGHHILGFDAPTINRLVGRDTVPLEKCIDTLILSRLANRKPKDGLGHSLKAWGKRLKLPKGEFSDWSKLSDEMIVYCKQDVDIALATYLFLWKKLSKFEFAVKLEHDMFLLCQDMTKHGFPFKFKEAKELYNVLVTDRDRLDQRIGEAFPPRFIPDREIVPSLTLKGTINRSDFRWYKGNDYTRFEPGAAFTLIEQQSFNPASPKQLVERLWESGWKPIEKTKGALDNDDDSRRGHFERYGWKISEKNLATLPASAPEGARLLLRRLIINTRITQLESWFAAYDETTGCVHGQFDSIGTWTHRMAHSKPNMANVAAKKSIKYNTPELRELATSLGGKMRALWGLPDDSVYTLVGTDAEGIQLRVFAHLINDGELIESLVNGDKTKGTDPHSSNVRRINEVFGEGTCKDRDNAKTFIYAYFLGAGDAKVASIFDQKKKVGKAIKAYMPTIYPGLKPFKDKVIPEDAKRGYFINVDGRPVVCDSEHHMLSGYLQAGEASIMKVAVRRACEVLDRAGIPYRLTNMVHDEMIFLVPKEVAEATRQITEAAIAWAGEELKLNCPMKGEGKIGNDWLEVH
jgi:DNA polymerase-1